MTIGVGIIGMGEAGQFHSELLGAPKQHPEPHPNILQKGRQFARHLLGRKSPEVAAPGLPGCELIAVSDVDERRLARARDTLELRYTHTDYKDLLARKDVDAVLICTPPAFHAEITAEAARQGKHIFCEKPMAMTSDHCLRMLEATEKAGVTLQIGYMLRFSNERARIVDAIRNNEIGRPVFYRELLSLRAGGPQQWIHDEASGGGPLFEVSHCVDFLRYVFGDPHQVFGIGGHFKPNKISAVDTYAVSLLFPSGDRALLFDSYALKGFGWEQVGCRRHRIEIDIVGPGGYIQFPDADLGQQLTVCRYGDTEDRTEKMRWTSEWGATGYRSELEHFLECIRLKKTPAASGHEGLRTVQLLETLRQSIRTGKVCDFRPA